MPWYELLAVALAGATAGAMNSLVGSGTLVTFPVLLALGVPPVTANVSNNIGLVPGSAAGAWGFRHELQGQGRRIRLLAPMSLLGSAAGALLLLRLPAAAFRAVVPVLLLVSLVLVVLQPRIQRAVAERRERRGVGVHDSSASRTALSMTGTFLAGAYGGYFGAAQGVLLIGLLGSLLPEPLKRVNALKNVLSLVVNSVAAVVFMSVALDRIDWLVVLLIAVGSTLGGLLGARFGRRLSPKVLRGFIVVVGVAAIVRVVTQ
ncbi:sulfite exporter TauE/SafE family protein [Angustibacter aerolatus]